MSDSSVSIEGQKEDDAETPPSSADEALRASEQQLRLITDVAPAFIAYCDTDNRFRFVNRAYAARFDLEPRDIIGKTISEVLGEAAYAAIREYVEAALAGRSVEYEAAIDYLVGGLHYMHCAYAPDIDASGKVRGYVAIINDVSDRKRVEIEREELVEALAKERERLERETHALETINRMSAAIASELSLDRLVQMISDEATTLTGAQFGAFFYNVLNATGESYMLYALSGVTREAFEGFPMPRNTAIFDPTFKGESIVRLDDVTKDPRYGKNESYHGMPKGHLPVRSYLAVPVVSRSGEVFGGLFFGHSKAGVFNESHETILVGVAAQTAIAMDNARLFEAIEREKTVVDEARRRAEEANRAKDEFLAVVSHELRTPLNSMLGWTRLLRSGRLDEKAFARGLETVERNTVSQAQLIEDLLDVSRIITGKLRLNVEPVDLEPVIQTAVDSVRPAADAKEIRLQTIVDSGAGLVSGDRERLQQIIWNLLANAIKFTPKRGQVRLQLARVDSHIKVSVADTGQGIDSGFLPHVFDRFRQADAGITRKQGGLGLGLAIVRHLVELHGGTVQAESDGAGKGSTFVVMLPVMAVRRESAKAQMMPKPSVAVRGLEGIATLGGVRVLVVDDEHDTREMLAVVLSECEAEVRSAGSAAEALTTLGDWVPDVLVSDIGMPGEDGYELIDKVRSLPPDRGGRIPAVALTAYARFEDRMRALGAGFQMHVAKPVEPAELVMVIHSLLEFGGR